MWKLKCEHCKPVISKINKSWNRYNEKLWRYTSILVWWTYTYMHHNIWYNATTSTLVATLYKYTVDSNKQATYYCNHFICCRWCGGTIIFTAIFRLSHDRSHYVDGYQCLNDHDFLFLTQQPLSKYLSDRRDNGSRCTARVNWHVMPYYGMRCHNTVPQHE